MKEIFSRQEVIDIIDKLLENPGALMDAITNEHTDYDGEELLLLAEHFQDKS